MGAGIHPKIGICCWQPKRLCNKQNSFLVYTSITQVTSSVKQLLIYSSWEQNRENIFTGCPTDHKVQLTEQLGCSQVKQG